MQDFTNHRTPETPDEFWLLEHSSVYTLGLAGLEEHILEKNTNIPVIKTDRGGQVTYHGPGQIIIYTLIDLRRLDVSIRGLVERIELGIINYLSRFGIHAYGDRNRPGVYVNNKKIASLGLRVRKHCTYHGLSFNYNMDLTPFRSINVCGYNNLEVANLSDLADINGIEKPDYQLVQDLINTIYKV